MSYYSYPESGLRIPKHHGASSPKEYDSRAYLLLKPDKYGLLTVESTSRTFKMVCKEDILKLFTAKWNFTYSNDSEVDCIFKFFKKEDLVDLDLLGEMDFEDYQIGWILGTARIRLQKNHSTKDSRYIVNVAKFIKRGKVLNTLEDLRNYVEKEWIPLNEILPLNPISLASTSKDLILSEHPEEFYLFNRLDPGTVKFLHTAYIGPRMESRCLGTIQNAENIDMVKAYLRALAKCPSLDPKNILKICKGGTTYYEEAHPGSVYEVEVTVPHTYDRFPPLPLRDSHILYPHGTFVTRIHKPYLENIMEVGDIPFKILDSVQIIPRGKPQYPFKDIAQRLEDFEVEASKYFKFTDLKTLHCTIHGHMIHFHREIKTEGTLEIYYETGQDYNPVNAGAVQAMVAKELWKLSQTNNAEAYRIDALSGYHLETPEGFRKEETGIMTFLTPAFKDKPGSTLYRNLINENRDLPWVRLTLPHRISLKEALMRPYMIGREKRICIEIEPLGGNRKVKRFRRIGELLENRIPTQIPLVGEDLPLIKGPDPTWLEEKLSQYHLTQT